MSRSKPESANTNPAKFFLQWEGSTDKGFFSYWDRGIKERIEVGPPLEFVVLDVLGTVVGFNQSHQQSIYSNEVKTFHLAKEELSVRCHKVATPLAVGLWRDIKHEVEGVGGRFAHSVYALARIEADYQLINLSLKGAALGAWIEFSDNQKIYEIAVTWDGDTVEGKKGAVKFLAPVFKPTEITPEVEEQAIAADQELQKYLDEYFGKHKEEKPEEPKEDRSGRTDIRERTAADSEPVEDGCPF